MSDRGRIQERRVRKKPKSRGQNATAVVVLDAIAEYCLIAHQLACESDLAKISETLESVLLEVGRSLSALEQKALK